MELRCHAHSFTRVVLDGSAEFNIAQDVVADKTTTIRSLAGTTPSIPCIPKFLREDAGTLPDSLIARSCGLNPPGFTHSVLFGSGYGAVGAAVASKAA